MTNYRKCAGAIVFNRQKKVLVCARKDIQQDEWQFPQGGIEDGESPQNAALRELKEETSISSVRHIQTLEKGVCYTFPEDIRQKLLAKGIKSSGQNIFWSLLFFYGDDIEINLETETPEFKKWKWIDFEEAVETIIPFKKEVYSCAFQAFHQQIEEYDI